MEYCENNQPEREPYSKRTYGQDFKMDVSVDVDEDDIETCDTMAAIPE